MLAVSKTDGPLKKTSTPTKTGGASKGTTPPPTPKKDNPSKTGGAPKGTALPPIPKVGGPSKTGKGGKNGGATAPVSAAEGKLWKKEVLPKFISRFDLDQGTINAIKPIEARDEASVGAHIRKSIDEILAKKYAAHHCDISHILPSVPDVELGGIDRLLGENLTFTKFNFSLLCMSLCPHVDGSIRFHNMEKELPGAFIKAYESLCPKDARYAPDIESVNKDFIMKVLFWNRKEGKCPIPLDNLNCSSLRETVDHVISITPDAEAKHASRVEEEKKKGSKVPNDWNQMLKDKFGVSFEALRIVIGPIEDDDEERIKDHVKERVSSWIIRFYRMWQCSQLNMTFLKSFSVKQLIHIAEKMMTSGENNGPCLLYILFNAARPGKIIFDNVDQFMEHIDEIILNFYAEQCEMETYYGEDKKTLEGADKKLLAESIVNWKCDDGWECCPIPFDITSCHKLHETIERYRGK